MKTAMIWGAGGGIGRALVNQLVDDGWTALAVARHADGLATLTPHVVEADTANPFQVQSAVMAAGQQVDEIDLWIYAAGDITAAKVGDMPADDWQRILNANLTGAFLATHFSLPLLARNAHLIYLGAISERLRLPGLSAYATAKAGLEAFVEALGKEERKRRVTLVRPGAVDTPLWEKVAMRLPKNALSPQALAEQIIQAHQQEHKGVLDIT